MRESHQRSARSPTLLAVEPVWSRPGVDGFLRDCRYGHPEGGRFVAAQPEKVFGISDAMKFQHRAHAATPVRRARYASTAARAILHRIRADHSRSSGTVVW
jgi:hypothetical protein